MRGDGLRKLLEGREADSDDDYVPVNSGGVLEDDDRLDEEIVQAKEAWLTGEVLCVDVSRCDFTKPLPEDRHWPVVCKKADTTAPTLRALQREQDFVKIMRAAKGALRTLRLRRSLTPEDEGATFGASVIAAVVGSNNDGTIKGMIWVQKRVHWLLDLQWNYGGSTALQCGLEKTLKAPNCFVCPVALVEGADANMGEGRAFEAMVIAVGLRYACQCPMAGVQSTGLRVWAPAPLEAVLANPQHELYKYAVARIPPPLTTPLTSEEQSKLVKEGLDNMSDDAKKRRAAAHQKTGVGLPGKDNYATKKEAEQLSRLGSYSWFLHLLEARECIQSARKPAPWAAGKLKPGLLKRVAKAGLAQNEFWTVLPKEEELGVQGFDMEEFIVAKLDGHTGAHVSDYQIETQRGPFPAWDVAVALGLAREGERAPKLPWRGTGAPAAVAALIARALAWSPPASQPSPPPAKKPRSAAKKSDKPRRSARLK